MARFFGPVGFASGVIEDPPGVFKESIVEKFYYGDILRNSRQLQETATVTDDIVVSNSISLVADPYASENFLAIRYVGWMGVLWKVSNVDVQSPRLILRLGEVYNGPTG